MRNINLSSSTTVKRVEIYIQKPADLIFFKTESHLGKLIRFFTKSPWEGETFANHIAGVDSPGYLIEAMVKTIKRPFNVNTESDLIEIYRYQGPIPWETLYEDVVKKANEYLGRTYGFGKLITHMLDALLVKIFKKEIFFFRKINHTDRYPICSWIWAFAYNRCLNGYEFGVSPEYATPDDMHDFVKTSTEWKLVYKG